MKTKRTMTVLVALVGLWAPRDAQAFYNPSTGRWLSRDPIGESGGLNLYAAAANTPENRYDFLGLTIPGMGPGAYDYPPYNCWKCRCKKVTVSKGSNLLVHAHQPLIDVYVPVPVKFEIEGDKSRCKCKHVDKGTVQAGYPEPTPVVQDKEVVRPCEDYTDRPGLVEHKVPSWTGAETYHLIYKLSITVSCEGDGSSASGSVSINAETWTNIAYNPDGTVTPTPTGPPQ